MDTFVRDLHRAVARARRWPRLERLGGGHAGGTANLKLTFHLDHSAVVGFESSRRERPGEVSGLAIARYCPAPGRIQRRSLGSVSGHENEPREGAAFRTKIGFHESENGRWSLALFCWSGRKPTGTSRCSAVC